MGNFRLLYKAYSRFAALKKFVCFKLMLQITIRLLQHYYVGSGVCNHDIDYKFLFFGYAVEPRYPTLCEPEKCVVISAVSR